MNNDLPAKSGFAPSSEIKIPNRSPKQGNGSKNPLKRFAALPTKKKIIIGLIILFIVTGLTGGAWALLKPKKVAAPPAPVKKTETPAAVQIVSPLTGMPVTEEQSKRPVTGVMIENSPDARPQSGLLQAGVVFEAIAEGGITRFLALFQDAQPDYIGPVRSARPYYIDWVQGFDASYVHAGGPGDAINKIKSDGVKDLNHFGNYFYRVNTRYAPHNLYTDFSKLDAYNKSKGYTSSTYTSFIRKKDKKLATPTAKTIDFNISSPLYSAHFDYDAASNTYLRSEGGRPHTDERTKKQISPNVVIAMVMQYQAAYNGVNSWYNSIGSGKVYIFQDGGVTEGTWAKTDRKAQITFKDAAGKDLPLNAGQTWISAVAGADKVSYKP